MKNECLAVKQPGIQPLISFERTFQCLPISIISMLINTDETMIKKEVLIIETISSNTMIINGFVVSKSGMMPPCSEIKNSFQWGFLFQIQKGPNNISTFQESGGGG